MAEVDVRNLSASDGSWVARTAITDPDVYALEAARIFRRSWCAVAHESQIPAPGAFITSWVGDNPVIVTRSRSGSIDVVLNSCSHRASRVCRVDQGVATTWVCPNHGWTFGSDGKLLGVPHQAQGYPEGAHRDERGLVAARVETRFGIVFASFDPDGPSLADHLGDAVFYLESVFDRYTGGTEVLGGTLRTTIPCNWKLAMENLGTDLQHPEFAHGAFMELWPDPVMEFMGQTEQMLTDAGHPACIGHRPPPYTEAEHVLPTITDAAERREVEEWFERTNREAIDRLGKERAEFYVFTGSVYPNFSYLPGVSAVFLLHPRGPLHTEWWTWCLVPTDAPPAVRRARREHFMLMCGPGGLILAEDAENWADMTRACAAGVGDRLPLVIDRGMGEDFKVDGQPGIAAPMRSEHVQRGFWMNWRRSLLEGS